MKNIKLYRKNQKMSQKDVGAKAGISESYYCLIEKGERTPSVTIAKRIGEVLGFNWTIFFDKE